ncbi:hypothetical protein [Candidatus Liberibacter americanus]|uniref:Lipoprotein n=1 Tax=Candidatus Liberibacter americanus str. Sao Paulo TaxID=1261131 RepID=U6B5F8_9HYPH|nr:hypothetical protein [Candidatus Liberibacter americanus]AHA27948.1 hypothetical protein lam_601 [Candidatus Liberibacter americanus str. Sao Paulo]EMS35804.1 hypothetical protein G653_04776 [Candidatus Liberibacter americanus PW_SP]
MYNINIKSILFGSSLSLSMLFSACYFFKKDDNKPPSSVNNNTPVTSVNNNTPATSVNNNTLDTSVNNNTPATSVNNNTPDTSVNNNEKLNKKLRTKRNVRINTNPEIIYYT